MSFKQAASNPFAHLPDGTLSLKGAPRALPVMGMANPDVKPLRANLLAIGFAQTFLGKCLTVIEESESGRNMRFLNTITGQDFSRAEIVGAIRNGQYREYEVCIINGVETPRSKADGTVANNLG